MKTASTETLTQSPTRPDPATSVDLSQYPDIAAELTKWENAIGITHEIDILRVLNLAAQLKADAWTHALKSQGLAE